MVEIGRKALISAAALLLAAAAVLCWILLRQPPGSNPRLPDAPRKPASTQQLKRFLQRPSPVSPFSVPLQWPPALLRPAGPPLAEASVEERNGYAESLRGDSARQLLERWLSETRTGQDSLKLDLIADMLAVRLRENGEDAASAIAAMSEYARNPGNDPFLRWRLVQTLGDAAAPNALQALLELADSPGAGESLEPMVLRQIARVGELRWDGRFHEELAAVLEPAWSRPGAGEELSAAVARAMAEVGAPASVELLLREALDAGPSLAEFESRGEGRAWRAYEALGQVRNVVAVPVLGRYLNASQAGDMSVIAAGQSLAAMGRPEATAVLLEWFRSAPADASVLINEWIARLRDPVSVELAAEAAAGGAYAHPANQAALLAALADWHAHRN